MATISLANGTTVSAACPKFPAGAQAFTPANDIDTFERPVTVYVGATGNVSVRPENGGVAVTFSNVPAGQVLPVSVAGVNSTGTTATGLVVIF